MSTVKQKLRRGELKLFNIIESKMLINCVTTFLVGKIKNISVFLFRKHTLNGMSTVSKLQQKPPTP